MLVKLIDPADIEEAISLEGYIYEPKLDGIRALCYVDKKNIRFFSRNDKEITKQFPELALRNNIKATTCILDGEIVVYAKNRSNFESIQGRATLEDNDLITAKSIHNPATYVVFDILELNGKSLLHVPLEKRKQMLEKVVRNNKRIDVIPYTNNGKKLWAIAQKKKLEGIVGKRFNSLYKPGVRDKTWIKMKLHDTADCVIIGFTQGKRKISALILGMYTTKKELVYIGKVGTGFSESIIEDLYKKFKPLITDKEPTDIPWRNVVYLKPKLVAEIKYAEWTNNNRLRVPVFIRLRFDKDAKDCKLSAAQATHV